MTDQNLIAAGCGVALTALCGIYVFLRDRFEHATYSAKAEVAPEAPAPLAEPVSAP